MGHSSGRPEFISNFSDRRTHIVTEAALGWRQLGLAGMHKETEKDDRTRLLEAAGALIAQGHVKFSITALCEEAGLERGIFRANFSSRAELLEALDKAAASENAPQAPAPEAHVPLAPAAPMAVQAQPPSADAWLERRLRVFERALTALEARAETTAREHGLTVARLEEKVRALMGEASAEVVQDVMAAEGRTLRVANGGQLMMKTAIARPDLEAAISAAPAAEPEIGPFPEDEDEAADETLCEEAREGQAALLLPAEPPPEGTVPRAQMAELLEGARRAARAMIEKEGAEKPRPRLRLRWLALGCLSLVALFIGIGLTLGDPAGAFQVSSGSGVSYRQVSHDAFVRMVARADSGDARAQAGLALAYLRGEKVRADTRAAMHWAGQAAKAGNPLGQYLMGALYHQGEGIKADPALALRWFAAAAGRGNVKAMHNLAIAYAEGQGTSKDAAKAAEWFARAAERGYVDSAFDLAVLYERGDGVRQDAVQALKWYQVAAVLGDRPSQERADTLRNQMDRQQIALADNQAREFEKLRPLASANVLPAF